MSSTGADYQSLYTLDFFLWSQAVAQALRQDDLDPQARQIVAEQIAVLGMAKVHDATSVLCQLLLHLMQLSHHICPRPHHHQECMTTLRTQLATALAHSPHLADMLHQDLDRLYQMGVQHYMHALQRGQYLPATCPFTLAQLLDPDFVPA